MKLIQGGILRLLMPIIFEESVTSKGVEVDLSLVFTYILTPKVLVTPSVSIYSHVDASVDT